MPSFAIPLLSPKNNNKAKVSRQLHGRTKSNPPGPITHSSEPVGKITAPTASASLSQKQKPTANASQQPTDIDAIRSSKKVKTAKAKKTEHYLSPLSQHKSLTPNMNVDVQTNKTPNTTKIPRMHRDMRIICDEFRISEQSRLALRQYDATRLEDFSYMTDEDYATMIDMQERAGLPIPPLQQRKIRVLLMWARSLTSNSNSISEVVEEDAKPVTCATSAGTPAISPGGLEGEIAVSSSISPPPLPLAPPTRHTASASGIIVPSDWEKRFYADLPSLKEELRKLGGEPQLPSWLLSLRIFCGFA